jgi:hypothetical protein
MLMKMNKQNGKKLCLTAPAIFEPVASEEDLFLRSADLREKGSTVLAAIKRTPLGRIMEVLRFKQSMGKSKKCEDRRC